MSLRSMTWRRIGVGVVAAATVAAGSPLLLGGTAHALDAARLAIIQDNGRSTAAAGTCTAFTVTASDVVGGQPDAATITVTISEDPNSGTHDVDFCVIDGGTAFTTGGEPQYTNAATQQTIEGTPVPQTRKAGGKQTYVPGPSITGGAGRSEGGNPDTASNTETVTFDAPQAAPTEAETNNSNNPSGEDRATFRTSGGKVRFGVVGLQSGAAAKIDAFYDRNNDQQRTDANDDGDVTDPGDDSVVAPQVRVRFTPGGLPNTLDQSNATRRVVLAPESTRAAKSSPTGSARHTYQLQAFNEAGDVLGSVSTVRLVASAGPNAPTSTTAGTFSSTCTATGNEGEPAVCTYDAQKAGTDTVTGFVNQSFVGNTVERDANEPMDTSSATTTPAPVPSQDARYLVLTPESATVRAGESRTFVATVTDVNGAPAKEVSVTFTENGPGGLSGGTSGTSTATRIVFTNDVGQAEVTFFTASTESGTNAVIGRITNPELTQCQQPASGTTPAGQCSDFAAVTVTASTASPSATPTATAAPSPSATTAAPSPSATGVPAPAGSRYNGLSSPTRVLDTRDSRGPRRTGQIVLDLSQQITDPNATTAVLNVTVTNATRRGFLVAYPFGSTKPGTSNVNFETNQTQANEVVVRMSADRKVSLFVDSAEAHVIADLVGSFTASSSGGRITTNAPRRAFDSRETGIPSRTGEVSLDLSGFLPSGATDAVLNVTVTRTTARGFVTVFPTGTTRPGTSNVNFERGQTQANEVITRVGTGANAGTVSFFVDSASAALVVDVVGAVSPGTGGQGFTALRSPVRALDTRDDRGIRRTGTIDLAMPSSVPANATGVILNVTATNGTRPGFVTVYPFGQANPGTSNVNFPTNLTQANEVTSGLGDGNRVTLFVGGGGNPAAHVIVDVVGYLTS